MLNRKDDGKDQGMDMIRCDLNLDLQKHCCQAEVFPQNKFK